MGSLGNVVFVGILSTIDFASQLGKAGKNLLTLVAQQEAPMLHMGTQVQGCAQQATWLQERLRQIYGGLQGNEGDSRLHQIEASAVAGLARLQALGDRMRRHQHSLNKSRTLVAQLSQKCESLAVTAQYFQVLALNMRIQASALPQGEELFGSMVQATKKLSSDVRQIGSEVMDLLQRSLQASDHAQDMLEQQLPRISALVERERQNLAQTQHKIASVNQTVLSSAEELQGKSALLGQAIAEIVVSLQFHDRLRQRVEHVATALESCVQVIASENSAGCDATTVHSVLALQAAQIADEHDTIARIAQTVEQAMQMLQLQLQGILSLMARPSGSCEGDCLGELLQGLLQSLETTQREQEVNRVVEGEAMLRLRQFAEITAQVQERLETILEWKVDSKLLSINAILLAKTLGENGAGLTVISQAIVNTAEQLAKQVEAIQAVALQIVDSSAEQTVTDIQTNSGELQIDALRVIVAQVRENQELVQAGDFGKLQHSLQEAARSFVVLPTLLAGCATLHAELQTLQTEWQGAHPEVDPAALGARAYLDLLNECYTMIEERKVFAKHVREPYNDPGVDAASADSGDIELF